MEPYRAHSGRHPLEPRTLLIGAFTLITVQVLGQQTAPQADDSMESLIAAFSGSWAIQLTEPASGKTAAVNAGSGEESWHAGPNSGSLIEEYHSNGAEGDITGHGVFWGGRTTGGRTAGGKTADGKAADGISLLWCDNSMATGCRVLNGKAHWKDRRLSLSEETVEDGRTIFFRETFVFNSDDSFTQSVEEGRSANTLKPVIVIQGTRSKR